MTINDFINLKKANLNEVCQLLQMYDYEKSKLEKEIKELIKKNDKEIILTDHAIIRYFERVLNLDVDKVRKEILNKNLITQYKVLGDKTYDCGDYLSVISNGHVVTILNKER